MIFDLTRMPEDAHVDRHVVFRNHVNYNFKNSKPSLKINNSISYNSFISSPAFSNSIQCFISRVGNYYILKMPKGTFNLVILLFQTMNENQLKINIY